ncbi:MAG: hypothetical protein Q4D93_06650 [Porphyromonas sp.]|nr:hypothetical protein [Porphyromonas sp.]
MRRPTYVGVVWGVVARLYQGGATPLQGIAYPSLGYSTPTYVGVVNPHHHIPVVLGRTSSRRCIGGDPDGGQMSHPLKEGDNKNIPRVTIITQ